LFFDTTTDRQEGQKYSAIQYKKSGFPLPVPTGPENIDTYGFHYFRKRYTKSWWYLFNVERDRTLRAASYPALAVDGELSEFHFLLVVRHNRGNLKEESQGSCYDIIPLGNTTH
jgi:hypothetical protein